MIADEHYCHFTGLVIHLRYQPQLIRPAHQTFNIEFYETGWLTAFGAADNLPGAENSVQHSCPQFAPSLGQWLSRAKLFKWLDPRQGTNAVKCYAVDSSGNFSATNSVTIYSTNAFKLNFSASTNRFLFTNGFTLSLNVSTGMTGRIELSSNLLTWATSQIRQ